MLERSRRIGRSTRCARRNDVEMPQSPQLVRIDVRPLAIHPPAAFEVRKELSQRALCLAARQRGTQAEVGAEPEAEMARRVAVGPERVRVLELAGIAIVRGEQQGDG